jgi:hypothetical protein
MIALTCRLESVVGVAFTPSLREGHENAVNLLRLGLQYKLATEIPHGCEDVEPRPVEEAHVRLPDSRALRRVIAQNGSCLVLHDNGIITTEDAERTLSVSIPRRLLV